MVACIIAIIGIHIHYQIIAIMGENVVYWARLLHHPQGDEVSVAPFFYEAAIAKLKKAFKICIA
jgi:hypothetical protein